MILFPPRPVLLSGTVALATLAAWPAAAQVQPGKAATGGETGSGRANAAQAGDGEPAATDEPADIGPDGYPQYSDEQKAARTATRIVAPRNQLQEALLRQERRDEARPGERTRPRASYYYDPRVETVLERPRPELEPAGIDLGGFRLHGQAGANGIVTSNVRRTSNGQGDIGINPNATVDLNSDWTRHQLGLNGWVDKKWYAGETTENSWQYRAAGNGRLDLDRHTQLGGDASFARLVSPRSATGEDPTTLRPVVYHQTRGSAFLGWQLPRLTTKLSGEIERANFRDALSPDRSTTLDQDYRDVTRYTGTLNVGYALTPDVAFFVQADREYRRYDIRRPTDNNTRLIDRDADSTRVTGGLRGAFSPLLRGDISAGFQREDYKSADVADFTLFVMEANLEWLPSALTTVTLNLDRRVGNPAVVTSPAYVASRARLRADHELLRNLLLHADAQFEYADFRNVDRQDYRYGGGVGGDWSLGRSYRLTLDARLFKRNSVGPDRGADYTEGVVSLGWDFLL